MRSSRANFIKAISVIAILVLLIVIAVAIVLTQVHQSQTEANLDSSSLIVSDDRGISKINLKNDTVTNLVVSTSGVTAFGSFRKGTVHWKERENPVINSLSKKSAYLKLQRDWKQISLAVDYVTGKIYIVNEETNSLSVFDIHNGDFGVILSDLERPRDLALDPEKGVMFIVQSGSVLKLDMDGSRPEAILPHVQFRLIFLDHASQTIYLADRNSIWTSDYTGNGLTKFQEVPNGVLSVAAIQDQVFWTTDFGINYKGDIWTCLKQNCQDTSKVMRSTLKNPRKLGLFIERDYESIENPCAKDNGGCAHFCLLKRNGMTSCGCKIGWEVTVDLKNCTLVDDWLLFVQDSIVRGRLVDPLRANEFYDAIQPFRLQSELSLNFKKFIDFDADVRRMIFAYSDDHTLYIRNLTTDDRPGIVIIDRDHNSTVCYKSLSLDWVTGNLYYIKTDCGREESSTVFVTNVNEGKRSYRKALKSEKGSMLSLVVHPNLGYLFFIIRTPSGRYIYRKDLTRLAITYLSNKVEKNTLAVNFKNDRIFWIGEHSTMFSRDVNGEKGEEITGVGVVENPMSIDLNSNGQFFVSNASGIFMYKMGMNKWEKLYSISDGKTGQSVEEISNIKEFNIFDAKYQKNVRNPCVEANACEQFCFVVRQVISQNGDDFEDTGKLHKICECELNTQLQNDGQTCGKS